MKVGWNPIPRQKAHITADHKRFPDSTCGWSGCVKGYQIPAEQEPLDTGRARRGGPAQLAPVQPRLPRGDRPDAGQGSGAPRVEAARLMLEEGRHTVETVAYEIGFGDRERMRRAFMRNFGLPPQAVRRTAQR
jgi:hypothetical protein